MMQQRFQTSTVRIFCQPSKVSEKPLNLRDKILSRDLTMTADKVSYIQQIGNHLVDQNDGHVVSKSVVFSVS